MRTYDGAARGTRALAEIFEASIATLVQDASEYGITGFVGGVAACFAAVALRLMHNAVADALIAPAVMLVAAVTFATTSEAFARGAENLQPDAGAALRAIASRLGAHIGPCVRLSLALFVSVLSMRLFAGDLGFWPVAGLSVALFLAAALYVYPRSLYAAALVAGVSAPRDAAVVSATLVRANGGAVLGVWVIAGLPAAIVALIGLASGFAPASAGIAALVAVASIPLVGCMLSTLFVDASTRAMSRAG